MESLKPGMIDCSSCRQPVARHPWFVRKRVRELSCPHCGAHLEVSVPAFPHYATAFVLAIVTEIAAVVLLVLFFLARWWWPVLLVGALFALEYGRSAMLRHWSKVRWLDSGTMARRAAGRWVPW